MILKLLMVLIVIAIDSIIFESSVHTLNLSVVCPRITWLGQPMLTPVLPTDTVKRVPLQLGRKPLAIFRQIS